MVNWDLLIDYVDMYRTIDNGVQKHQFKSHFGMVIVLISPNNFAFFQHGDGMRWREIHVLYIYI